MQFIGLRRLLPKRLREPFRGKWNNLLKREEHFRERRFYQQFIEREDLVFDVGANRGHKTAAFLSLGARVVAIEPNPVCANYMRENYRGDLEDGRLRVEEIAIGSQAGELVLTTFASESEMCSGSKRFLDYAHEIGFIGAKVIKAQVRTLDDLVGRFGLPKFIKIDAEGMDADILKGLDHRPQLLSFEFNTSPRLWEDTCECFEQASRLGFCEANFTFGVDPKLRLKSWIGVDAMLSEIQRLGRSDELWGDIIVR
ncbi:MAG TPA: FkbM family methyltransferase [Chthoniobacterales bacterium]|nr:FkbM family methyltransferase [Chthoniobacterales bacterium]